MPLYVVHYTYPEATLDEPHVGRCITDFRVEPGDDLYTPQGRARVRSCRFDPSPRVEELARGWDELRG